MTGKHLQGRPSDPLPKPQGAGFHHREYLRGVGVIADQEAGGDVARHHHANGSRKHCQSAEDGGTI